MCLARKYVAKRHVRVKSRRDRAAAESRALLQDWVHFGLLSVSSPAAPTQLLNRPGVCKVSVAARL